MDKGNYFDGLARTASQRGGARFSRFLDPAETLLARQAANRAGVGVWFFGGCPQAERVLAAFGDEEPQMWEWPLSCAEIGWSKHAAPPAHRDLLGAQMALGLDRECFGDILVGEEKAYLFLRQDVESYVAANFEQAGRTPLKITLLQEIPQELPQPKGKTIRVTLGGLRLDGVTAAAWNLSRSQAQNMINREQVKLNHVFCTRTDQKIQEGDLISARGLGRARVVKDEGITKKGRQALELFLYGGK